MWNWIKNNKLKIWSAVITAFSIYATFYPFENFPKLKFYEKSAQEIFSLKDTLEVLKIYCNGVDVKRSGLGIKMYNVKLMNKGDRDVRKDDYGDAPFGLDIKNGKVISLRVGETSNREFAKNIIDRNNIDSTKILLKKTLIRKGDYVFIQFAVLYKALIVPNISNPIGEIADSEIEYTKEDESDEFSWSNIIKFIIILALFVIGLMLGGFLLSHTFSLMSSLYRRFFFLKKLKPYFDNHILSHRVLMKLYCLFGKRNFIRVLEVICDKHKLKESYFEECENEKTVSKFNDLVKHNRISTKDTNTEPDSIKLNSNLLTATDLLRSYKLISISENEIIVDKTFLNEALKAIDILKN